MIIVGGFHIHDNFSRYRWVKIRQKLGLDDFKFHDLRKTFGSVPAEIVEYLVSKGADVNAKRE